VALTGCGDDAVVYETWPCEPGDLAEVSFDPAVLVCVQLDMVPEDFEELGNQYRFGDSAEDQFPGVLGHVYASCTEPFPDPYTWFSGDVVVDGLQADDVGVRKKGFIGSVLEGSDVRPSLKIKTDEFQPDQTLAGTERVTLNNNLTDRSRVRSCLAYSVFVDAGHPAPRCNLANVMVNGDSLGAYTHVEAIKKDFLRQWFTSADGSLYEATLADFTDAHLADGLGRWEAKTGDTETSTVLLQGVADALKATDDELEQALDAVMDLDLAIEFWALETLLGHSDGHASNTNNTYVYFDPDDDDRAVFIPWGPDGAFVGDAPITYQTSEFARRLSRHAELNGRYLDALQGLLDQVWDEGVLQARIDQLVAHVDVTEQTVDGHASAIENLRSWIDGRRVVIEDFIAQGGEAGAEEPLGCNGGLNLEEFADLAGVMVLFSHSCTAAPGPATGLWALALLLALARQRRVTE